MHKRFVPYGIGSGLLNTADLSEWLAERGLVGVGGVQGGSSFAQAASSGSTSTSTGATETICSPIEAEKAMLKLTKKIGDTVAIHAVIAELQTDKASIEINTNFNERINSK